MKQREDETCNTGGARINELTRFCRFRRGRVGESTESELILSRLDLGGASGAHLTSPHFKQPSISVLLGHSFVPTNVSINAPNSYVCIQIEIWGPLSRFVMSRTYLPHQS